MSTPAPRPTPSPTPILNQTTYGRIRWHEIWRGEIHIVGDIIVEDGATLTIRPGTVVLIGANQDVENLFDWPFDMQQGICPEDDFAHGVHRGEPYRDEGHHISIRVFGTLRAVGTEEVRSALQVVGLAQIHARDAQQDLEQPGGVRRTFFASRKPARANGG